jgi:two-component system chemotaxis response regulator CheY
VEALEKALERDHDLFLVDINMPVLDGLGFLRRLRREDVPQAPAIMVSTEAQSGDLSQALAAGANDYLVKPVKPPQLLAHAKILLGEARP